jgi:hypothetical protein
MDYIAGWRDVTIPQRPIPCPVRVHPPVVPEPRDPSPPDRVNLFQVHYAAVPAIKKHILLMELAFPSRVNQVPEMVFFGIAIIRLVIEPVIPWQVALTIGLKQLE